MKLIYLRVPSKEMNKLKLDLRQTCKKTLTFGNMRQTLKSTNVIRTFLNSSHRSRNQESHFHSCLSSSLLNWQDIAKSHSKI